MSLVNLCDSVTENNVHSLRWREENCYNILLDCHAVERKKSNWWKIEISLL